MKRFLLSVAVFACVCVGSTAQMGGAPPELDKLDWAKGEWTGTFKFTMPGGQPSDFASTIKNERETNFLKSTTKFNMEGMDITEVSYLAYDAKEKTYKCWSFTNMSPLPRIEKGTVTGDSITFISDPWDMGMGDPVASRSVMTKKGDKEMTFTLEFKMNDKWEKVGEGTFTKKATTR